MRRRTQGVRTEWQRLAERNELRQALGDASSAGLISWARRASMVDAELRGVRFAWSWLPTRCECPWISCSVPKTVEHAPGRTWNAGCDPQVLRYLRTCGDEAQGWRRWSVKHAVWKINSRMTLCARSTNHNSASISSRYLQRSQSRASAGFIALSWGIATPRGSPTPTAQYHQIPTAGFRGRLVMMQAITPRSRQYLPIFVSGETERQHLCNPVEGACADSRAISH